MSRHVYERRTRLAWVTTIASIAAPTVAELAAGVDITPFISKDGVNTPANQNMVDNATITDSFDAQLVGSFGGSLTLTMYRDTVTADDPYEDFEWGDVGFVVIRYGILYTTAFAAAQRVEVYPAQAHEPVMQPSAANANAKFTIQFAVTDQPEKHAVVAA